MNDASPAEKSRRDASGNSAVPDLGACLTGYGQALDSWARASAALMKGMAELSQEIMTFSQSRFQAGIDAWQTAAACRSPADLFENQKELTEKAAARYFADAQKFAQRATALMNEVAAPLRQERATKR
jgi:phasin family protein